MTMTGKLVGWGIEQATGSPTRKLMLAKLCDQANDAGDTWPCC